MAISSIQQVLRSRIAVNNPNSQRNHQVESKTEKAKPVQNQGLQGKNAFIGNKFSRPTLLKNPNTKVDSAKLDVAEAHTTLTRASVHADLEKQAKAHKKVQLGFTRTPRVISKLIT